MLVKDIIKKSAEILELDELLDYYKNGNSITDTSEESVSDSDNGTLKDIKTLINKLLLCVNLTNNTIASQYFEIVGNINVNCGDGVIPYSTISTKEIVDIKYVLDCNGNKKKFSVLADGVHVPTGNLNIIYSYLPDEVSENSTIDYYTKIGCVLFSYGVVAEYLFLIGDIESAYSWDKRFKEELFSLSRPRRSIDLPSKRWY